MLCHARVERLCATPVFNFLPDIFLSANDILFKNYIFFLTFRKI